jgi:glycine/D-amino acid oxidase-like deaminating enzyme
MTGDPAAGARAAWRGASSIPFWLDKPHRPAPRRPLTGTIRADLVIIGGGFTGLWTALRAKEREPSRDVALLEAHEIAWAASGRNGGFCSASLTHGAENGRRHFPDEYERLHKLGLANLDAIEETIARYGIDCGFERNGTLSLATAPWQAEGISAQHGTVFTDEALGQELRSPAYVAGVWERDGSALLDPAELAWGLARACEELGVRIFEHTAVTALENASNEVVVRTTAGAVSAGSVALATNAFRPLLRRLRLHTVPVYDYALVTEPLTSAQLESVGWANRQGLSERSNQFHYSRLTRDDRILWGGYDAVYYYGRETKAEYDQRPETFDRLSEQFFATFPQLEGLRFTHAWGGAIDTCTRFCAFYGTAMRDRVAYAMGFTGLGVGASRFAGDVMLDLLGGLSTERTRLEMVRRRPVPFPPEPLAYAAISVTKNSIGRADANEGRRDLWLRTLDRLGLGFDS